MKRFDNLLIKLEKEYPNDWWIKSCRAAFENNDDIQNQADVYSEALEQLDISSWNVLEEKIIVSFKQTIPSRGKQPFFNLLNEALAYQYLLENEYEKIICLPEKLKIKTPDISCLRGGRKYRCEVKTISVSEEELKRGDAGEVFDDNAYSQLSEGFINKLSSTIEGAILQLSEGVDVTVGKLIYIIIHFDDMLLSYFSVYKVQINEYLSTNYADVEMFIRVGVLGKRNIHHTPTSENF